MCLTTSSIQRLVLLPRIPPWPSSAGHFAIANTWLISRGATAQFHRVHPICLLSCACARTDEEMICCHSRIRFYVRSNWLRSVMIIRELHSSTPLASSFDFCRVKQAIRFCSLLSLSPLSPWNTNNLFAFATEALPPSNRPHANSIR